MPRFPRLRLRLTAWYAGSILVFLVVTTVAIDLALHRVLRTAFHRSLHNPVEMVRNLYEAELLEFQSPEATIAHVSREVFLPDRNIRFLRPDGSSIRIPQRPGQAPPEPPLVTLLAPLHETLAPGWAIEITGSEAESLRVRQRLDLWIGLGVVAATLVAAGLGWWLTGRTLAPVGAMARAAEQITPDHLAPRIPVENPGDELGRLARRFNDLLDRLASAMTQQRRFLDEAAHELRTPIARMRARLDEGMSSGGKPPLELLESLNLELETTTRLVDQLLHLARADAGQGELQPELLYLDDLVLDAAGSWRTVAGQNGIRIECGVEEEVPVRADRTMVRRLLDVLLDNAIRYTPRGGTVQLRPRRENGTSILEITDTGIGIPPDQRARVLERFYRSPEARRLAPHGSGLGLPIAHDIVARHGGTLTIASNEPEGTVVRVSVPTRE